MPIRQSKLRRVALLATALSLLAAGCVRIARQEAPYYKQGPRQPRPPDGFLSPGTKVMVFGEKESYKRVLTFDGIAAYVWKNDLATPSEWKEEQLQATQNERGSLKQRARPRTRTRITPR